MQLAILILVALSCCLAQRQYQVYYGSNGTLADGFHNFSWATVSLTNTEVVHSGDKYSISFVCKGWAGLYLAQINTWSISNYNVLSFWLNGGPEGNEGMTVQLISSQNSKMLTVSDYIQPNHVIPANTWIQVKIPLSQFQAPSNDIKGFWFQGNSNSGTSVAYFDDITFLYEEIPPVNGPNLAVDASSIVANIHPEIYGITMFYTPSNTANYSAFAQELSLPLNRIGGDATTRYNWQVDSSNSGDDWYFMGGSGSGTVVPGDFYDSIIAQNNKFKTRTVVTVPMIEYINGFAALHCSFPKSVYGPQQSYNPYEHPNGEDCGNGKDTQGNDITDKNPTATDILNTPSIQKAWIQHLNSKWGNAEKSGIIYQLDNEVSNWGFMHRDVHPNKPTYTEITNQTIIYASAIKSADPTAIVAAPSEIQFAWYPAWGGDKNMIFYLQQLKEYDQKNNIRLLDSLDVHYPDANDNNWPVLKDVASLKNLVDSNYPGTFISFSEWSLSGLGPLGGSMAVADQLGHFAANGALFASYWGINADDLRSPITYTFRMFRNYDGKGAQFGNQYVNSTSQNDAVLSVHSAIRQSDGALTIMVINKLASAQKTKVSLRGFNNSPTAQVWEYGINNQNSIVNQGTVSVSSSGFDYSFSAFSLTLVVLPRA